MKVNEEICHCNKVTAGDIEKVVHAETKIENVEKTFEHVRDITRCSTGCGGCYDKVIEIISEIMYG